MITYAATCRRVGKWWAISVPELKGLHTQVRRLGEAEETVRDAIALFLDVPANTFDIRLETDLPEAAAEAVQARSAAETANRLAAATLAAAARRLHEDGLTYREIGALLGISPQRVAQVLQEPQVVSPKSGSGTVPAQRRRRDVAEDQSARTRAR